MTDAYISLWQQIFTNI